MAQLVAQVEYPPSASPNPLTEPAAMVAEWRAWERIAKMPLRTLFKRLRMEDSTEAVSIAIAGPTTWSVTTIGQLIELHPDEAMLKRMGVKGAPQRTRLLQALKTAHNIRVKPAHDDELQVQTVGESSTPPHAATAGRLASPNSRNPATAAANNRLGASTTSGDQLSQSELAAVSAGYPTASGYPATDLTAADLASGTVQCNGPEIKRVRPESFEDKKRKAENEANTAALRESMSQLDETINTGALVEAEKAEARRSRIAELENQITELQSDLSEGIAEVKERAVVAAEWRPTLQEQLKDCMTSLKDDLCTMWDTMDDKFEHSRRENSEVSFETVSRQQWAAEQMEALAKRVSQMQQLVEGQLQQVADQALVDSAASVVPVY